jgi:hypothetical protein
VSSNFYRDVEDLSNLLVERGYASLGDEIRLAVEASSTGTEIMMRLRKLFEDALDDTSLPDDIRARITPLLEGVNRVL